MDIPSFVAGLDRNNLPNIFHPTKAPDGVGIHLPARTYKCMVLLTNGGWDLAKLQYGEADENGRTKLNWISQIVDDNGDLLGAESQYTTPFSESTHWADLDRVEAYYSALTTKGVVTMTEAEVTTGTFTPGKQLFYGLLLGQEYDTCPSQFDQFQVEKKLEVGDRCICWAPGEPLRAATFVAGDMWRVDGAAVGALRPLNTFKRWLIAPKNAHVTGPLGYARAHECQAAPTPTVPPGFYSTMVGQPGGDAECLVWKSDFTEPMHAYYTEATRTWLVHGTEIPFGQFSHWAYLNKRVEAGTGVFVARTDTKAIPCDYGVMDVEDHDVMTQIHSIVGDGMPRTTKGILAKAAEVLQAAADVVKAGKQYPYTKGMTGIAMDPEDCVCDKCLGSGVVRIVKPEGLTYAFPASPTAEIRESLLIVKPNGSFEVRFFSTPMLWSDLNGYFGYGAKLHAYSRKLTGDEMETYKFAGKLPEGGFEVCCAASEILSGPVFIGAEQREHLPPARPPYTVVSAPVDQMSGDFADHVSALMIRGYEPVGGPYVVGTTINQAMKLKETK